MKIAKTDRESQILLDDRGHQVAQQSSAIRDYEDSMDKPGSSCLWIGDGHLDREEVAEYIKHLEMWLETGFLGD